MQTSTGKTQTCLYQLRDSWKTLIKQSSRNQSSTFGVRTNHYSIIENVINFFILFTFFNTIHSQEQISKKKLLSNTLKQCNKTKGIIRREYTNLRILIQVLIIHLLPWVVLEKKTLNRSRLYESVFGILRNFLDTRKAEHWKLTSDFCAWMIIGNRLFSEKTHEKVYHKIKRKFYIN